MGYWCYHSYFRCKVMTCLGWFTFLRHSAVNGVLHNLLHSYANDGYKFLFMYREIQQMKNSLMDITRMPLKCSYIHCFLLSCYLLMGWRKLGHMLFYDTKEINAPSFLPSWYYIIASSPNFAESACGSFLCLLHICTFCLYSTPTEVLSHFQLKAGNRRLSGKR